MKIVRITLYSLVSFTMLCGCVENSKISGASAGVDGEEKLLLHSVQRDIIAMEYRPTSSDRGLQAPNRAHDFRTYFRPGGIQVRDRIEVGGADLLTLRLDRIGRGRTLASVGDALVTTDQDRVELRRDGIVEWYLNSSEGLEQGFTIERPAIGSGPLTLDFFVGIAEMSLVGEDVIFETESHRMLSYRALAAVDAMGRRLDSHFDLRDDGRLRIVVDDQAATYPIVIDPLLMAAPDGGWWSRQANAQLGFSVADAGDVNGDGYGDMIVGARWYDSGQANEGAAFVFLGTDTGIPSGGVDVASAQLESNQAGSSFGFSVAGAGDVNGDGYADVIVGAIDYDAGQIDEGAAFVFLGSASGVADGNPTTAATLIESDQSGAWLGVDVAGAGDVNGDGFDDVLVGADHYDAGQNNEGIVVLFLGSAAGIANGNVASADSRFEANQASTNFGISIAGAGDMDGDGLADVVIGARDYDAGQVDEGAAFIFRGNAAGMPNGSPSTAAARFESDQANALLGISVAGAGDVNGDGFGDVIVGAPHYDAGHVDEGAAFVFLGSAVISSGSANSPSTRIQSGQTNANLGISVDGAGDLNADGYADVIVGANLFDAGQVDEGAAFVFVGAANGVLGQSGLHVALPGSAWAQLEANQAGAGFGYGVSGAGDVNGDGYSDVLAGVHLYDGEQLDEGAAFVYFGAAKGIRGGAATTARWSISQSSQPSAYLGASVDSAGDVNGDGFGDLVVGAPGFDSGSQRSGAVWVLLGSDADGLMTIDEVLLPTQPSPSFGASFGISVSGAGDLNDDGYSDIVVGGLEGVAVYYGSTSGVQGIPNVILTPAGLVGPFGATNFGSSVDGAGDVNGDGFSDLIIGNTGFDAGASESNEGAAFVFLGSATGVANGAGRTFRIESTQPGSAFGYSVAGAGDLNGDGYGDMVVGAPIFDGGEVDEGAVFIAHGTANPPRNGLALIPAAQIESDDPGARFGISVARAGDVNGDGFGDMIVGAPSFDAGLPAEGVSWLFLGRQGVIPSGSALSWSLVFSSDQSGARFGERASGAGDVNGDGYADVIVGSSTYDAGQHWEGAAFIYLGGKLGPSPGDASTASARIEFDQSPPLTGTVSVAGAGDLNGDGIADVITGNSAYSAVAPAAGAAFVFLGNSNGQVMLLKQRRGDGSNVAVQSSGNSWDEDAFIVELTARHPDGLGRIKAQFEVCPTGVRFGEVACTKVTTPSWISVFQEVPEAVIAETISGLASDSAYRWRARVLYAPSTGPIPPAPAHGPWRRFGAGTSDVDIRTDGDRDGDGLLSRREQSLGTNPDDPDSDDDGLSDGDEVNVHGTNPIDSDTDEDGLTDRFEVLNGFDPMVGGDSILDPDSDAIDNLGEQAAGTDPNDADTDDDGAIDGVEVGAGTNPLNFWHFPVELALVEVQSIGNPVDSTGFGRVSYRYSIARYEVTVRYYVSFLNSVARTDPFGLFEENASVGDYGIIRTGDVGSYAYSAAEGHEHMPVTMVSIYDAMRFVNWLHNGQPVGSQSLATTEDGAYFLSPSGIVQNSIVRKSNYRFALPNENEWYKSAYYDEASLTYSSLPFSGSNAITCSMISSVPSSANCDDAVGGPSPAGAYSASPSAGGTFDQGGERLGMDRGCNRIRSAYSRG